MLTAIVMPAAGDACRLSRMMKENARGYEGFYRTGINYINILWHLHRRITNAQANPGLSGSVLFIIVLLFSACGSGDQAANKYCRCRNNRNHAGANYKRDKGDNPETADKPAGSENDDFTSENPALAVMIDNDRMSCHRGTDKAQIVYEIIVEGGLTRLMPIFWGTDTEMIGPVRAQALFRITAWNTTPYMYITVKARRQAEMLTNSK